jgi:thiol:disulfide interchange protein DsbD
MEAAVWTDPKVKDLLDNRFVLITLMVDDKSRLPAPIEIEEGGRQRSLRTVGDKWSFLQRHKFGANAQPFYVILDTEGNPVSPSYSFNEDVAKYVLFLENGLRTFSE